MNSDVINRLREYGIQPTAQRVAVAEYILATGDHPSADQVWTRVRQHCPMLSRATVYNSLNLFVEKGLLRQYVLAEGKVVFDPHIALHHHFIDDESGAIYDIPWDTLQVSHVESLTEFDVREYQVIVHGRKKS